MSVITRWTVTPNRVGILYRYLSGCGEKGERVDDLSAFLTPPTLQRRRPANAEAADVSAMTRELLDEGDDLRLIERFDDEAKTKCVHLAADVPSAPSRKSDDALLVLLERRLLSPLEGGAQTRTGGALPLALAWLLEQDPARPLPAGQNVLQRVETDCGTEADGFELKNESSFRNFLIWARYLGYLWRLSGAGSAGGSQEVVVPDPTAALQRHLPALLRGRGDVPLDDLVREWGASCPVLEGGWARLEVERLWKGARRPPRTLSRSTSLALTRLQGRGLVRLLSRSDGAAHTLQTWPDPVTYTHITLAG